jgi:hypothetical protein
MHNDTEIEKIKKDLIFLESEIWRISHPSKFKYGDIVWIDSHENSVKVVEVTYKEYDPEPRIGRLRRREWSYTVDTGEYLLCIGNFAYATKDERDKGVDEFKKMNP